MLNQYKPRVLSVNGIPMTTSIAIAEHFQKLHKNVIRNIKLEILALADEAFTNQHFQESSQIDSRGQSQPIYRLTETGFTFIAMGFTGAKASRWKRVYTETFLAMRDALSKKAASAQASKTIYLPNLLRMSTAELVLRLNYVISQNEAALLWLLIQAGAAQEVVHVSLQSLLLLLTPQMKNVNTIRAARKRLLDRGLLVMSSSTKFNEGEEILPTGAKGYKLDQAKVAALTSENELKWLQPFREEHGGRGLPGVTGTQGFRGRYSGQYDFLIPRSGEDIFARLLRLEKESPDEPFITSEPLKAFLKERLKIEAGIDDEKKLIIYSDSIH